MMSGKMYRFRPDERLDPRFLELWLLSPVAQKLIDQMKTGISDSGLNLTHGRFTVLPVPVPELDEQRRIVAILEDHLSCLDAATASVRASVLRLDVLRRLVVKELAVGDMVPLKQLAVDAGYGTSVKCDVGGAGPAVVRIPNLRAGRIDLSDEKRAVDPTVDLSGAMLRPGDVLIVRTNGSKDLIGRSGVVQDDVTAAFASYLIRYRVDTERLRPRWLQVMLESPTLRVKIEQLAASSAGQHNLSLSKLDGLLIPTPSLEEQDAGLARLAAFDDQADTLHDVLEEAIQRGESLRRALLAAAFSGRLSGAPNDMSETQEMIGA